MLLGIIRINISHLWRFNYWTSFVYSLSFIITAVRRLPFIITASFKIFAP